MALQSPGVEVTVIDESFYTPAEAGTTPLVVVATAQDKTNASGTGIAQGTLAANAGKVYRVSSQRELVDFFGTPVFKKTISGAPLHGDEQNEYGLQAAYSLLGVSNSAFILRADVNLNELTAQSSVPGSEATDGQWWLDTQSTRWGIFQWDSTPARVGGQRFVNINPIVITQDDTEKLNGDAPAAGVGRIGDYAVVASTDVVRMYVKGTAPNGAVSWQIIGSDAWRAFNPTVLALGNGVNASVNDTFYINGTLITIGSTTLSTVVTAINNLTIPGVSAGIVDESLALYVTGATDSAVVDSTDRKVIELADGTVTISALFGQPAGNYYAPDLAVQPHTSVPQWKSDSSVPRPAGSVWVKTTEPNLGARWRMKQWNAQTKVWADIDAPLYANGQSAVYNLDRASGGSRIARESLYVQSNYTEDSGYDNTPQTASFKIFARRASGTVGITSNTITAISSGLKSFSIRESRLSSSLLSNAATIQFTAQGNVGDADRLAQAINNSPDLVNIEATVISSNRITVTHRLGGEFRILDTSNVFDDIFEEPFNITNGTGTINMYTAPAGETYDYVVSGWLPLAGTPTGYVAASDAPKNDPVNGQRWYSSLIDQADIMIHNGETWVGYLTSGSPFFNATNELKTDPNGPIVSATRPTVQSDGSPLRTGDLWIDTSDLENYPMIYKYNTQLTDTPAPNRWVPVDKADTTSEDGIVFADARWSTAGDISEAADITALLDNSYLDPDAPDPAMYPRGILLFNTRRSGFNVKVYRENYIDITADNDRFNNGESMINYDRNRWVTDSGTLFGRKAQRSVVVSKLKEAVATSQEVRESEVRNFNLMSCPGYPELIQNLIELNTDRGSTAFVVGDTPLRLPADTNTLSNWGNNLNAATDNGDQGIVSFDEYTGVFYPSGLTTDNTGNTVMVPASHMMLKTIALSDQVSYPWFAPAGIRRGGVTNATSVGYLDSRSGEFRSVNLTDSQRDALYNVKVNPITFFNGVGLVNYGQRTRAAGSSALDRINVARLVIYLRSQLNRLAKPFVFEPNDKITRDEVKQAVESLLLELVGLRALYDYAVVCDESNNTPSRIDRNELYLDIAIEPVKSIEFIYIPLRLKNTGEIQGARSA